MSIQKLEIFHGAVLSKITRNKKNKISLIEWEEKENRALYSIETENNTRRSILIKYNAQAGKREKRKGDLVWNFNNLIYREDCYFCLVCVEEKRIDQEITMEICAVSPEKALELFEPQERKNRKPISCVVSLKPRQSFRVGRKQKEIELIVSRNEIDKI